MDFLSKLRRYEMDPRLISQLVSHYLTNQLIRRGSILYRKSFDKKNMRISYIISYQHTFRYVIRVYRAGYPRVTHPSAALFRRRSLDLHVLGTPPAFILSQDQTLKINSSNLYRQRYIFATASDTSVAQINLITCSDYHYLNIWLGLLVSIL